MQVNPHNYVVLHGRPVINDYTDKYKVIEGKDLTVLTIPVAVFDEKGYLAGRGNLNDIVTVKMFGHLVDDTHKYGGQAEKFLAKASSKVMFRFHCHLKPNHYTDKNGVKHYGLDVIVDEFECDNMRKATDKNAVVQNGNDEQTGLQGLSEETKELTEKEKEIEEIKKKHPRTKPKKKEGVTSVNKESSAEEMEEYFSKYVDMEVDEDGESEV